MAEAASSLSPLLWIWLGGIGMALIALVGGVTTFLQPTTLERILLPMVALAAGTLLGGAFFHMLPEAQATIAPIPAGAWLLAGFTLFLALEQFFHWHHSHHNPSGKPQPVTYLILLGDGLHNFLGGLSIASTFLLSPQAGMMAWIAAVAHEIPQELGDFGILVHGGWRRRRALLWNALSGLTFLLGGLLAYSLSQQFDTAWLVLFGAGNFIYIAASDLIPAIKQQTAATPITHFSCFLTGLLLMYSLTWL